MATTKNEELFKHILGSKIFSNWHYYSYHFGFFSKDFAHPFAKSIVDTCIACDDKLPGFAKKFIDAIASISGREKYKPHYEQLLQRVAELHIINRLLTYDWPFDPTFNWEPTTKESKKNPELTIEGGPKTLGIEVKAPSLLSHIKQRQSNPTQLSVRFLSKEQIA